MTPFPGSKKVPFRAQRVRLEARTLQILLRLHEGELLRVIDPDDVEGIRIIASPQMPNPGRLGVCVSLCTPAKRWLFRDKDNSEACTLGTCLTF